MSVEDSVSGNESEAVSSSVGEEIDEEAAKLKKAADKRYKKARVIEYIKRYTFLLVGLVIMSYGVGLSVKALLGTSPVSAIPNVTSIISGLTIGTTTIIVNAIIVLLQVIVLRRKFNPFRLLQIPVCTAFGLLTDFSIFTMEWFAPVAYWQQWLCCAGGIILVAVGVSFEVTANVITLAGEGLVLALCTVFPKVKFGIMKIICDCSMVVIAVALSFIFLQRLDGVREGTIAAAVLVGLLSKQFNKFITPLGNKIFMSGYKYLKEGEKDK